MKRNVYTWSLALLFLSVLTLPTVSISAQTSADTIFVYHSDGRLHAFPMALVKSQRQTTKMFEVVAVDGKEYRYDLNALDGVSTVGPDSLPRFAEFKFNNKFNDQVYQDVVCNISAQHVITASVPCVGKWLTPSFPLYETDAEVYANGVRQVSKQSRLDFSSPIAYTVTRPGYQVLRAVPVGGTETPVNPTLEPEEEPEVVAVPLTADMFSTNAPSNYPLTEGLDKLIDGDITTFFHSTWGTGAYEKLPLDEYTYIDVKLPEALHRLQFSYTTRQAANYHIISMTLQVSKDGITWKDARSFSVANDNLPTGQGEAYTSPIIDLDSDYGYLRFLETEAAHKNYLVLAELAIYKVLDADMGSDTYNDEPQDINTDDYTIKFVPYGTEYTVALDFPADRATTVPAIYITTSWGIPPYSKTEYMDATIRIDGAGLYPDMEETEVQIRGRGNSSWNSNAYTKNPYRLKFAEKLKPFGLTKGKSWVLLSNRQAGSMTTNAIGMKVAQLAGAAGANHMVPVDLYMNGSYWGSYNFTEKVGFHNNSIEVDDETVAALLELDSYYDETYKFKSDYYNLPVNIKEPDFSDPTSTQLAQDEIERDFNEFMSMVSRGQDISSMVDIDALAAFLLTNEYIMNLELMHPKSTYLYKANYRKNTKYIWGPVWDLDWSYGYESQRSYFQTDATANFWTKISWSDNWNGVKFMRALRNSSETVDRAMYKAWSIFINRHLEEVIDFCDAYYAYAKPSLEKNNENTNRERDSYNYATITNNAKRWLRQRAQYIYATLTPYDIDIDDPLSWQDGYEAYTGDEGQDVIVGVDEPSQAPTLFDVYDMRGLLLKRGATFKTFRDGLAPGIYMVNGKKVLIN